MGVFFSGVDIKELEDNAKSHNFYLSLVVNNKMETVAKVISYAEAKHIFEGFFKAKDENGDDYEIEKAPSPVIQKESGYGAFLSGRSLVGGLPRPRHNVAEEGRVVVDITVNPAGYVIATSVNSQTNTSSTDLCKAAMEAAQKARFNAIDSTGNQVGTITYYFQLR